MLYASNLIVHDTVVKPQKITVSKMPARITGTSFLKLTTSEKV